jgi:hypothetical protein
MVRTENYRLDFMKKILALLFLLVSSVQAQVQYCGSDSSQRTLVNLALYSEQADNAYYTKTRSSVSANSVVAPDGTTTADSLIEDATAASDHRIQANITGITNATANTVSFYMKAGTRSWIGAYAGFSSATLVTYFNATACTVGTVSTNATASAEALSNGWCRFNLNVTSNATSGTLFLYMATGDGVVSYTGDGASLLYLWGLQVRPTSSPSTYIRTTDTQVTAGLANTTAKVTLSNLALRSEEFDNAAWTKTRSSVSANTVVAPDGATTAETLIEDGTAVDNHQVRATVTVLNATQYRYSVYLKANTRTWAGLQALFSTSSGSTTYFNLATCTVGTIATNTTNVTATNVGNGWCRVSVQVTSNTTSGQIEIRLATADTVGVYNGDSTSSIYVWGAQLNLAALPPDYLATTTAAATLANVCPSGTSQSLNDPSRCFAVTDNRIRRW